MKDRCFAFGSNTAPDRARGSYPCSFLWYPEPERGAVALALRADTDVALTAVNNGLADGKSEARTLHVVIQLDKALEDCLLLVLGDARAGVLAIEVETRLGMTFLSTIAHADMTLLGILDGIGDEVSQQLLYATLVEYGRRSRIYKKEGSPCRIIDDRQGFVFLSLCRILELS